MADPIADAVTSAPPGSPAMQNAEPTSSPETRKEHRIEMTESSHQPPSKRRLLVFSHACVTAVNQSFFHDVASAKGWTITLVVPASWDTEYRSKVQVERWPGFTGEIYQIPVWRSGNIPLHVYKSFLVTLLRKINPDYIYVHHEPYGLATAQIYLANKLAGNCPIGFYAAQNIFKRYPPPFRWFEHFVLRNSDFAFPVTEGALEVIRRKGYQGHASVLPLAIDKNIYYPRPAWAHAKRQELLVQKDELLIGYLGRLVEEKGLRTVLLSLKSMQGTPWRCILIGSGPMEPELRALASELNLTKQVSFIGFVRHEEVPFWLSLFDVLVLASETRPNWKEQFGRVITEANACGTPVIGTDSGEIGNVLRATGGGIIIPERNAAALSEALIQLAENPQLRESLVSRGLTSVSEQYDQLLLATRFASEIENASAGRR